MSDSSQRIWTGTQDYIASPALRRIVNVAVTLERPLLIKGEPGTGKTLLAEAISEALGHPLIRWHVKSTTRAQDGLYVYDTVQRLYDSRFDDAFQITGDDCPAPMTVFHRTFESGLK